MNKLYHIEYWPNYGGGVLCMTLFGCGVAPIRIETGRYEHLSVDERKCLFCNNVEDEGHVLFNCHLYEDIRLELILGLRF